jgi:hypothetical protein
VSLGHPDWTHPDSGVRDVSEQVHAPVAWLATAVPLHTLVEHGALAFVVL